jgi:hypothetical protein
MRIELKHLVAVLACLVGSPALAGLTVTSYRTLAQTNGYAPTNQTQYFAEQRLETISPADAFVSGDWTGPNADGTPDTWHFVGTARATSRTTITPDSYTVEAGEISFAYLIDTTSSFVNPTSINIFGPSGTGQYRGVFETDVPLVYDISAQLNQRGRVRLSTFSGPEIFDENNSSTTPRLLTLTGTIPPGTYQFLATSGLGAANLPAGVNHYERSGSLQNLVFSVRVPEPGAPGIAVTTLILATLTRFPRRRARPSF